MIIKKKKMKKKSRTTRAINLKAIKLSRQINAASPLQLLLQHQHKSRGTQNI